MAPNRISTGDETLDSLLRGGIPENRTVLVVGGAGTGKSTLGMQFLQAGLEDGESCLFISTEQVATELKHSFDPFEFDLAHDDLTITTIHAVPGHTLETTEKTLTLRTLGGEKPLGDSLSLPFTSEYIQEVLEEYAPCDRVVFDSLSGIASVTADYDEYRRTVLDLIRLFTDEFEATTMFTAESGSNGATFDNFSTVYRPSSLQFNTHGVIRLWREKVRGDSQRLLEVVKMRGIDHDTREFGFEFGPSGIEVAPRVERYPDAEEANLRTTGIPSLDALCGGGFIRGDSVLLKHDGLASRDALLRNVLTEVLETGEMLVFIPSVEHSVSWLRDVIPGGEAEFEAHLDEDRLFVVDVFAEDRSTHENIVHLQRDERNLREMLAAVDARRGDRAMFVKVNIPALIQVEDADTLKRLYYWSQSNVIRDDDTFLYVLNEDVLGDSLVSTFEGSTEQVLRLWVRHSGLQYVRLEKSPQGCLGGVRLWQPVDEPPYVRFRDT